MSRITLAARGAALAHFGAVAQEKHLKCPACGHTTFEGSLTGGKATLACCQCKREYTLAEIVRAAQSNSTGNHSDSPPESE